MLFLKRQLRIIYWTGRFVRLQVRPPKRSNLSDTVVDQQLNFIRDFVKVEDSDQATELAFIMMSTVKSFGGEMFDRKAVGVLFISPRSFT